jgi:hypothetical protein
MDMSTTRIDDIEKTDLDTANEDYIRKVRDRLQSTVEKDRVEEKDRVREKHRKQRLQEKAERVDEMEGEAMEVTLGGVDEESESGSSADGESSGESSGDESELDAEIDVKQQEELALAMIRGV